MGGEGGKGSSGAGLGGLSVGLSSSLEMRKFLYLQPEVHSCLPTPVHTCTETLIHRQSVSTIMPSIHQSSMKTTCL